MSDNSGHRERLKLRVAEHGPQSLADYELLELLLVYAIPRKDTKPIAKSLLAKYGTISNIFATPISKLEGEPGLGTHSATLLHILAETARRFRKESLQKRTSFANRLDIVDYLYTSLSGLTHEEFHVIFLNTKQQLIADSCMFKGTLNASAVYPREVVKMALDKGAAALVLAHNHPSGNPTPSADDEYLTTELAAITAPLDITILDHIIIGDGQHYSFYDKGKL